MRNTRLRGFILAALFAAITAVFAQIQIPMPLGVPMTGQTFAVGLTATILGSRLGTFSMILYAILGAIGLPVFAGALGGFQIILGPTGGYIIGFIATAYVMGLIMEKSRFSVGMAMLANVVGMVVTLIFGVIQLKYQMSIPWDKALMAGVYPFVPTGLIKAVLASYIGIQVRNRLAQARLLPTTISTPES